MDGTLLASRQDLHAIGIVDICRVGHAIVGTVELHVLDARVALDASGLLKPVGDVRADLAEDGNLSLEDLLVGADLHLAGDVVDESLLGAVVEDLLPKRSRGVKVLRSDGRQV